MAHSFFWRSMPPDPDLIRGTLNTILLEVISRRPMYGYEICKAVNTKTQGYFDLREGSLYPALHRLERDGLLKSYWEQTDANRRRKYYQITDSGREVLARKREEWREFAGAIERVLATFVPGVPAT
ncbi:MAG TPA: PadR family transcriptional regulator [Phycisphaerae bacterium]|nr:PadR family transcriptional regulator [Phycisphaerae bacterium]HOM50251.1 PadR family transcriptional regulator [Phycisphaerae bacterium]HOQ88084.1 PadR family transcriptional regulator [Phycisphaerae bacterium]HPP27556.1 PadR family transcriptional regulator [Phycisphaerae bacterium]HPZ99765.1 PadR family transcriptional regulator [Phycisphaerae bacterium]